MRLSVSLAVLASAGLATTTTAFLNPSSLLSSTYSSTRSSRRSSLTMQAPPAAATAARVTATDRPTYNEDPEAMARGQMRPRPEGLNWERVRGDLASAFGLTEKELAKYDYVKKEDLLKAYTMMEVSRQFENACNQAYMQGKIRGFMHLDNGQESIPALVADTIREGDIKHSYYREHTHALASGVSADRIMAELFAKVDGTCKGAGGSMHIYDISKNFQGGWALVSEQLPYAVGAARSILLDRQLDPEGMKKDDRITIVFIGEGGAQNGRMAECLNAAAKEGLPILFLVIDNGRAINTFTPDVAQNSDVYKAGMHYGIPGVKVDGQNMADTLKTGRAVVDYVREKGPAILQVRFFALILPSLPPFLPPSLPSLLHGHQIGKVLLLDLTPPSLPP